MSKNFVSATEESKKSEPPAEVMPQKNLT